MGIVEAYKERLKISIREEAMKEARKEVMEEARKKMEEARKEGKAQEVRNLIVKLGMPDEQAAEIAEVPVAFVKKIRASLK